MAKEIVKEILLKFKGDSKPLERDIKQVEKVAANLQKTISGGQAGAGPNQLSKTLDNYIKQSNKFGMSINKDMSKFQKTIQEVAMKDLKVLQRQTDDLFRKTEGKLTQLRQKEQLIAQMEGRGDSQKRIEKQRRKATHLGAQYRGASSEFASSADAFNQMAGGQQSPMERNARMLGVMGGFVGGATASVAAIPATIQQMRMTELASRSTLSETMKQRRMDFFSGNLTEAMLQRKDNIIGRSQGIADAQTRNESQKRGIMGVGGVVGGALLGAAGAAWTGAQLGALGGSVLGPIGTAVGGVGGMIAGGVIGAGGALAASGALPYFFGGGQQMYHEQQRRQSADQLRKMSMNDEYYKYLSERAPMRYELQRQTGMGDAEAGAFRLGGMANFFGEEQSSSTLLALRGSLGNRGGRSAAAQAMEIARNQGLSLQSATGMAGAVGMSGAGGAGGVKKALSDIYSDAFSRGVTDSGLIEVFQKGMADIASRSPDITDIPAMAARLTSSLETVLGGRSATARDVAGAIGAANALGQFSMQGGAAGFSKATTLSDMMGGNTSAMAFFGNRTDQEIENLVRTGDPRAMDFLSKAGMTQEGFLSQFGPAATFAKTLQTTQAGQSMVNEIRTRLGKGESLTDVMSAMGGQTEVLAGMGKLSPETAASMTAAALDQIAAGDPALKAQLDKSKAESQSADLGKIRGSLASAKTDDERERALTSAARRFSADIDAGRDASWLDSLPPEQASMITNITSRARNARGGSGGTAGSRAEAQQAASFEGMSELERKATQAIMAEDISSAAAISKNAAGGNMGLDQSVENLKTALDAFVKSVSSNGTAPQTEASGLMPGDVSL